MAKSYTQYYRLCQWEPTDKFMRTEFNQDNQRVETALRGLETSKAKQSEVTSLWDRVNGKSQITAGTYTGDGSQERHINVGLVLKAVLVEQVNGVRSSGSNESVSGGLAVDGGPLAQRGKLLVEVNGTGFFVYNQGEGVGSFNVSGNTYHYVAFG